MRLLSGDEAREALKEALAREPSIKSCLERVTPHAARDVLGWAKEEGGWATGHFACALIQACALADVDNFTRLLQAFPALASAWYVYARQEGGLSILREIGAAEGACDG